MNNLDQELSNHIANCLGLSDKSFNKVGFTVDDLMADVQIKFNQDGDEIYNANVWTGFDAGSNMFFMCTNISSVESYLVLAVVENNKINFSIPVVGFYFNEGEGEFYTFFESKWVEMSLIQKLKLTTLIETISQEGVLFSSCKTNQELYKCFSDFIKSI